MLLYLLILQCAFPKNKDIFLCNHNKSVKVRMLTMRQYYCLSCFATCRNDVLLSKRRAEVLHSLVVMIHGSCLLLSGTISQSFFVLSVLPH